MKKAFYAATLAATLAASASNAATVVFEEDFSDDLATITPSGPNGSSRLNFDGFDQFSVSDGTVDIIQSGTFSINCATGGACVDLDGSTGNSGLFSSISLTFLAGADYTLSASLSGNQRNNGTETGTYGITGIFSAAFSVTGDAFTTLSNSFSVGADTVGSIFFQNDGGDNVGAVLDQVSLSVDMAPVPLPASALLMVGAVGGLAGLRRRKRKS